MIKKVLLLMFALLVFGCMSWAANRSFSGTVSDDHCAAKHAKASADAEACVEKCVAGGAKYVLVSHGKVYQLSDQDKFKGLGGKAVKVMGSLSGDTITVTSVSPAGGKMEASPQ